MLADALIVGAGPAGSTAAGLLAQAGWSVVLVEKTQFPRQKVCGEFVSATNLPLLQSLGVAEAFSQMAGPPVTQIGLYSADLIVRSKPREIWGRALAREHLDLLLRDAALAQGVKLMQPAEVVGWRRTPFAHICSLKTEKAEIEIAAKTVIGACGSWGGKSLFANLIVPPSPLDLFAFKGSFQDCALDQGLMPLLAFPGGYGGMAESDHGHTSFSCCIRRDILSEVRLCYGGRAAEAVLAHIISTTKGVALALNGARLNGSFLCVGPIRPGIRFAYKDGIFMTGNLAGEAHPIIAEGISMAMQSAALLARLLITKGASEQTAIVYSRLWQHNFGRPIRAASLYAGYAINNRSRGMAQTIIYHFPKLLDWGAQISGKGLRTFPN